MLLTDEEIMQIEQTIIHKYRPSQHFIPIHKAQDYEFFRAIANAEHSKTLKAIIKDYYCIPFKWCNMSPGEHFDGIGGCWGISGGDVLEKGRDYCKGCKYYRE